MNYQEKLGIKDVKHVILVSSGKGGVGKSTVSANIATALRQQGNAVGILDADIYGPSQAMMFGIGNNIPLIPSEDRMFVEPYVTDNGIKFMSIATRITEQQALNWKGTMVAMVLQQLIYQTNWGELDYLVIDMPPGTGDIQIFICDKLKEAKAVIVTTPQNVAIIDCEKGIDMFLKSKIKILGLVENMSMHICSCCGNIEHIFGNEGGDKLKEKYGIEILGRIPITKALMSYAENGQSIITSEKEHPISKTYLDISNKIITELSNNG
jgi:ATP-binding protein involved in chromosome partitioning